MLFSVAEKNKKGRGKVHSTIILYHLFGLTDIQLTFHVTFTFCSTDVFWYMLGIIGKTGVLDYTEINCITLK